MPPWPCSTASRPSPSAAYGRPPSCHNGSANSSSAGYSAWAGSPTRPTWYRFHQPGQSETTYRLVSSRHTGASTDSLIPPLTSRPRPSTPSEIGATLNSVPSQGIRG